MLAHLRDPVYVCRPTQILARMWYSVRGLREREETTLPWGGRLTVCGTEKNGRTIVHRGLKELLVTEACFRLSKPGTVAIDVGANVGHMTSALAHGMQEGRLYAYEPHPKVYRLLEKNADQIAREVPGVSVTTCDAAIGNTTGTETLYVPSDWSQNHGLASMQKRPEGTSVEVDVCRLADEVYDPVQVLKLDVEGHEDAVLEGAEDLLVEQHIQHIIFEDHDFEHSTVVQRLRTAGYEIFAIGKELWGPELRAPTSTEGYNFIASSRVDECVARFEPRGWASLQCE